ncbi:MAG: cupin domain-containing protein [Ilumatobacteraceae bacterium]
MPFDAGSASLYTTPEAALEGRPTTAPAVDARCAPGSTAWRLWVAPPGMIAGMHRTDTVDYDTILAGEIVLVLDDGEIELGVGDCVVLPGAMHGWRAGPEGSTVSVVQIGIEPAS